MFNISLTSMIFIYLGSFLGLTFALWLWCTRHPSTKLQHRLNRENHHRVQCAMCYHVYIDSHLEPFSPCPQCQHINDRELSP